MKSLILRSGPFKPTDEHLQKQYRNLSTERGKLLSGRQIKVSYHNTAILKTYACLTPRIPFPLGLRFFAELDSIVAMVVVNNI